MSESTRKSTVIIDGVRKIKSRERDGFRSYDRIHDTAPPLIPEPDSVKGG